MATFRSRTAVWAALLMAGAGAFAQSGDPSIRVDGAWARRAVMMKPGTPGTGTGTGAVYLTLVNSSATPDALLSAATDAAATVEVHESYMESTMAKMRRVARIEVPAGQSVELKPGGYHIMLIDLTRDLTPGQSVQLTLTFQRAGKVPVTASIK
jgi:periplasmic copper chaperone A